MTTWPAGTRGRGHAHMRRRRGQTDTWTRLGRAPGGKRSWHPRPLQRQKGPAAPHLCLHPACQWFPPPLAAPTTRPPAGGQQPSVHLPVRLLMDQTIIAMSIFSHKHRSPPQMKIRILCMAAKQRTNDPYSACQTRTKCPILAAK
jgi:hypothetical protein